MDRDSRKSVDADRGAAPNGTSARLSRASRPFEMVANDQRHFHSPRSGVPMAMRLESGAWRESSTGDPMHKLILVTAGLVDVEGGGGGWLVLPNHMIFVPTQRPYNLRVCDGTEAVVVHLDPTDCAWRHKGCWVTTATTLACEMIAYALRLEPGSDAAGQILRTISYLCRDWFANPRMLFMPAARSPELRRVVAYVRDNLTDATVVDACRVSDLPQRTLYRRCQQELGFGIRTLIREVRIMRAMELLTGRDHTIQAVARAVGFASVPSFTAAFSQRLGVSPSEFTRSSRHPCGLSK